MRIGLPSTVPTPAPMPPGTAFFAAPSGDAFQAALENSSLPRVADFANAAALRQTPVAAPPARVAGKQQKTQAPADVSASNSVPVVTVPSGDQRAATNDQALSGQPTTGQGAQDDCSPAGDSASQTSSTASTSEATLNLQATPIAQSDAQRPVAPQAAVDSVEQAELALPRPASAQPHGPVVDEQTATGAATPSIVTPQTDTFAAAIAVQAAPVAQAAAEAFTPTANLPSATVPANKADGNQPASKATPKDGAGPAAAKGLDLANAADAQKTKAAEAATGTNDPAQQHSQGNNQPAQHPQPDASQTAATAPRAADGSASQMQAVPAHIGTAPQPAAAPSSTSATPAAPQHADVAHLPSDGDDMTPATGLNAARIIQTMGETEMRVGMHSADFGNISIRASVSEQQMVARISLDHSDLSQAIAAHASAVQTKLGDDFGMRASIEVNHQGASSGDTGGSPQREQRDFSRSAGGNSTALPPEAEISLAHAALVSAGDGPRLDIRA